MKRHKTWFIPMLALVTLAIVLSATLGVSSGAPATQTDVAAAAAAPAVPAPAAGPVAPTALPTVMASADFAVLYDSVEQLEKAAALVVRGEVTQVSYLDFNSTAYTKVTLKVSRCLKGDVAAGDEITIAEVGGVTSMATVNGDKFGPATKHDAETKVSVLLDGAPLTKAGEECLYFLGQGSIGVVPGTYYVPVGAFQGRFKINDTVAERFVPDDWQGGEYTSLSMDEGALEQTVLREEADH